MAILSDSQTAYLALSSYTINSKIVCGNPTSIKFSRKKQQGNRSERGNRPLLTKTDPFRGLGDNVQREEKQNSMEKLPRNEVGK